LKGKRLGKTSFYGFSIIDEGSTFVSDSVQFKFFGLLFQFLSVLFDFLLDFEFLFEGRSLGGFTPTLVGKFHHLDSIYYKLLYRF